MEGTDLENKNEFVITPRDRVLRAWQNSTELVRDYQLYAKETKEEKKLSELFSNCAEDEALHASSLLKILQSYDK